MVKVPIVEVVGLSKNYDYHHVESLETPLVEMSVLSGKNWLTKFVQEVAKPSKERYPSRTLYGIVAASNLYSYCSVGFGRSVIAFKYS